MKTRFGVSATPAPEELCPLRALIVLESIDTAETRLLLEEVAKGPPSARSTRQARSFLACIPFQTIAANLSEPTWNDATVIRLGSERAAARSA